MRLFLAATVVLLSLQAKADITIATVGPMTGQYASIGEQMAKGAQAAVDAVNKAGGVLGEPLKLEVMDDVCDPKQATTVAHNLANQETVFVAGHFCSSASIPASEIYDEEGILMISPASTAPSLTDRGLASVFRLCGRDDQQGLVAGTFIVEHFAGKNVAVIDDKTAYGKGLADITRKTLENKGMKPVLVESITPGERDFTPLITKMKRAKVSVVFFGGYHTEAGLIKRQARDQHLDLALVAGDSLITTEYWTITGDAGAKTFMTFSPDPRLNPNAKEAVAAFRAAKYEPEGYTLYNYAAVQVFAEAAKKAGKVDSDGLLDALHEHTFDTVIGKISFDEKGDVKAPTYVVYEWKNGSYHQIAE